MTRKSSTIVNKTKKSLFLLNIFDLKPQRRSLFIDDWHAPKNTQKFRFATLPGHTRGTMSTLLFLSCLLPVDW